MGLRYTSEIVTDCVLGLKAESFSDKPTPIVTNIKKIFDQSIVIILYFALLSFFPILSRIYKLNFVPKDVEAFFLNLMNDAIAIRKNQLATNEESIVKRVDFLNYLLELQKKKGLGNKDLAAHTMTFLLDGYETTAAVLAHTLLLVRPKNPT